MIPSSFYYEVRKNVVVAKQVKNTVAAIGITEQSMLATKRKINRPGYKFSEYFR